MLSPKIRLAIPLGRIKTSGGTLKFGAWPLIPALSQQRLHQAEVGKSPSQSLQRTTPRAVAPRLARSKLTAPTP